MPLGPSGKTGAGEARVVANGASKARRSARSRAPDRYKASCAAFRQRSRLLIRIRRASARGLPPHAHLAQRSGWLREDNALGRMVRCRSGRSPICVALARATGRPYGSLLDVCDRGSPYHRAGYRGEILGGAQGRSGPHQVRPATSRQRAHIITRRGDLGARRLPSHKGEEKLSRGPRTTSVRAVNEMMVSRGYT
jgi:hypothetical protein